MYNPSRSRTRAGGFQPASKVPLKGLFVDGTWHCNCEPRPIAVHLQTKNGGKNHGRWFYTCQKSHPKRCKFFLWDDDAKIREKTAVLNSSRSEPAAAAQTPKRPTETRTSYGHPSPATPSRSRSNSPEFQVQYTPSRSPGDSHAQHDSLATTVDEDDSFDLPLSNEAELIAATDYVVREMSMPPPETPQKAQKTSSISTPGSKRNFSEMEAHTSSAPAPDWRTPSSSDDVFTTPKDIVYPRLQLPSPFQTPTPNRFKDAPVPYSNPKEVQEPPDPAQNTDPTSQSLITEVLALLSASHITLPPPVHSSLEELLNRHELRTQGIIKGREISRLALKAKDLKIAELQGRIGGLEAERETNRSVIVHLKSDIRESRLRRGGGRRS